MNTHKNVYVNEIYEVKILVNVSNNPIIGIIAFLVKFQFIICYQGRCEVVGFPDLSKCLFFKSFVDYSMYLPKKIKNRIF